MNIEFIQSIVKDLQWKCMLYEGLIGLPIKHIIIESRDSLFVEYENGLMFRWYRNIWAEVGK